MTTAVAVPRAIALLFVLMAIGLTLPERGAAAGCPRGAFCLWEHQNYWGGLYYHTGNDGDLRNDYFGYRNPVNNAASSLMNNGVQATYADVAVYDGLWNSGARLGCIPRGWGYTLAAGRAYWNDAISSFTWVRSC